MLHLNIWYVNIIELMKGIDNGKKISICRIFGIEKSFFEFQIVFELLKCFFQNNTVLVLVTVNTTDSNHWLLSASLSLKSGSQNW